MTMQPINPSVIPNTVCKLRSLNRSEEKTIMISPAVPTIKGGTDMSVALTPWYPMPSTINGRKVVKAVTGYWNFSKMQGGLGFPDIPEH